VPTTESTNPAYSANRQPIFISRGGILGYARLTNQVVSLNATTGTPVELYDSSKRGGAGALVEEIRVMPLGTNVVTVLRLFYRFSSMDLGQWNPFLDVQLPAVTAIAADNKADAQYPLKVPLFDLQFPTGGKGIRLNSEAITIGCGLGVAIANGVVVTLLGGEYK
jgi:hypothetical protein